MSTIIVAAQAMPDNPFFIAINRDEFPDRPGLPPIIGYDSPTPILGPTDEKTGGTWFGVSPLGHVAALTNRYGVPYRPGPPSRSWLVMEALRRRRADAVECVLEAIQTRTYNAFHLIVADASGTDLVVWDGEHIKHSPLHNDRIRVFTECSRTGAFDFRCGWLDHEIEDLRDINKVTPQRLLRLLKHHEQRPLDGTCIHAPMSGYETRSSTCFWIEANGTAHLLHAEGPPCRAYYEDYSDLAASFLTTE
ncbi:MAG: NRDE family protein [Candidatus Uhrbacteria bacterium]